MIIDIETRRQADGKLRDLNISYFDRDGEVAFKQVPLEQEDAYVWEYARGPLDKVEPGVMSWDNRPVRRAKTSKINKYTIEEVLMRKRDQVPELYEFNLPKKFAIDIETEITDGFPDPEHALNRVTAISIANFQDKRITVLGLRELSEQDFDKIQQDIHKHFQKYPNDRWEFKYVRFDSEYDMLYTFFGRLMAKMPCITGWNVLEFDWKYLVNRADRIKIDPGMSGWLKGKDRTSQHKLIVDYMDIVKKWDRVIKIKENFKLDYIAEKATGIAKIKYPGTLKDLYEKDFVNFVFYSAVDSILLYYIDQRLNTMTTFFKLASITEVEIARAFSPVWVQEALMTREFFRRGRVMVEIDKSNVVQQHFVGAYVKDPVIGLHEWVCCYDFASLYPNTMIQFNISPEMFLGHSAAGLVEGGQILCANGALFDAKEDSVMRTILKDFYGKRKETKGHKLAINKEIDFLKKHLQENF